MKQIFTTRIDKNAPFWVFVGNFFESKLAAIGFALIVAIVLLAVFAPLVTPQDPYDLAQLSLLDARRGPGTMSRHGYVYLLGTDGLGRDMYSAIIYGLRVSLSVGALSTMMALCVGTVAGLAAAFFRGWVDLIIMRIVDLTLGFPAILIALVLLAVLGPGVGKTILALVLVQWAYYARTIRGTALSENQREYIEAAKCQCLKDARIIFKHLMPNCLAPLIVVATVQVAHAISLEATLSFLGLGIPLRSRLWDRSFRTASNTW